jgi:hypothetical protein
VEGVVHKISGIVIVLSLMMLSGCGKKNSGDEVAPASETQQQLAQHQPPSSDVESSEEAQKNSLPAETQAGQSKRPPASKTALESGKKNTASQPALSKGSAANDAVPTHLSVAAGERAKAPVKPIILRGAPLGGVRFEHAKHAVACETCHHPPREPKRISESLHACTSCHTKTPGAGMKTGRQAAFHNASATTGICIDCHKKSSGAGPTKCMQCHNKGDA